MPNLPQHCHFIGIGGIGMSGIARILLEKGVKVTGSDLSSSDLTKSLIHQGALISSEHSAMNIPNHATVIFSSIINSENPELLEAQRRGNPIWHRSDLLHCLMQTGESLAVAGTHGKTTTTALLASVLTEAESDPTFINGGIIKQYGTNARSGHGRFVVAEADESDGSFTKYSPKGAIVTNIETDHMDHFGNETDLLKAFSAFIGNVAVPKLFFYCGDDKRLQSLSPMGVSYGFGEKCALRATNDRQNGWMSVFDIVFETVEFQNVEVALVGKHNILNALAVFGLTYRLGIPESSIRKALREFGGVKRRCDHLGKAGGVLVIDDYAHHPTEVQTTLHAIRDAIREKRLIAIFQPHRYSRTEQCLTEFAQAFEEADLVVVTDLYAAGEQPIPGITAQLVENEIAKHHPFSVYIPKEQMIDQLSSLVRPHDVIVTMGAGDISKIGERLIEQFKQSPPRKLKVGLVTGGRSLEHEVAYLSAKNIHSAMHPEYYQVQLFGIGKDGVWHLGNGKLDELQPQTTNISDSQALMNSEIAHQLQSCDVIFPVLHGPYGEDGTIQGFFEILDKAHVGADHRGAAISMDKARSKKLASLHGVPTLPYVYFTKHQWKKNQELILQEIFNTVQFPLFVKAVHLGSSIGVAKVEAAKDLIPIIKSVFRVDTEIIVELGVNGREIEFSVLGNDYIRVFPPGEILTEGKVYDYNAKYGPQGIRATPNASLPPEVAEEGMKFAEMVYRAAGCQGMARVDFFLDQQNHWWFNEINPIPGFTPISLYPKGCEVNGLPLSELIDALIILGLQRQRKNHVLRNLSLTDFSRYGSHPKLV